MSTFSARLPHGTPYVDIIMDLWETGYGTIGWQASVNITSGSRSGTWAWNAYVDGTYVGGGEFSPSSWSGVHVLGSGAMAVGHDSNGNHTTTCSAYLDDYYAQATASGSIAMTRIPLAPTISSNTSTNIKSTTVTLNGAVSDNGHGSSTTITYFYRVSGVGSYTNAGTGSSKNITGLKPSTNYQWYITAANNYGDTATGSVQTFKTKGVAGLAPLLMALLQG